MSQTVPEALQWSNWAEYASKYMAKAYNIKWQMDPFDAEQDLEDLAKEIMFEIEIDEGWETA